MNTASDRGVKPKEKESKKSQYATISVIGSGSCGTCKLVRSKNDGQSYVLKKIDIARCFPAEKRNAYQEVSLFCFFGHRQRLPPLLCHGCAAFTSQSVADPSRELGAVSEGTERDSTDPP